MITAIRIQNYKSFKDFRLDGLGRFTCIIGLNGSGKTTLLHALEGIGRLAHGEERPAQFARDCLSFGSPPDAQLEFTISFGESIVWEASFDVNAQRVTAERITNGDETVLSADQLQLSDVAGAKRATHGSLLAHWDFDSNSPHDIVKRGLQSLKNLGLLSPALLCAGSGRNDTTIHGGGWGFAGFLASISGNRKKLLEDLHRFYPDTDYCTTSTQGGGKYLAFKENNQTFSARLANDGLLRTLAILSQRYSPQDLVLFDEIENGFNQELVDTLVHELLSFQKQVIVTTHSALVVNFLPDDVARQSVVLFYKNASKQTQAKRFFDIPEMRDLLPVLPSGQIMSQTNLIDLSQKLAGCEAGSCAS